MFLGYAGIFALLYFPLLILGSKSSILFLVDVTIPQKEGRNESNDITFIQTTLSELTGIKVVYARKAFDNQRVILILEVEQICRWSSLTSALSKQGYRLSVTPLQSCSDYAAELGVDINNPPRKEIQHLDILEFFEVIYHDEGKQTDDYITMVKKNFQGDRLLADKGVKYVCFRALGNLPVRLIYFTTAISAELRGIYKKTRPEGKASIDMSLLQSLQVYTNKC